jgi:hypothetical protein
MYASVEDRDIPFVVDLINRAYRGVGGSLDGATKRPTWKAIEQQRHFCAPTSRPGGQPRC